MSIRTFLLCLLASLAFVLPLRAQNIGTVTFGFDSSVLDPSARAEIKEIAGRLLSSPSYKPTVVVGFTDAVGSQGYNQQLGLARARSVQKALIAEGVPVSRIGAVGSRGKNELLVAVAGPERRNRRVTVALDDIFAACRSWRDLGLTEASVGAELAQDLRSRLAEAAGAYEQLRRSGVNGPAYQMAGAAREDCGTAVGFRDDAVRKVEYAQRCLCNFARMKVALQAN